MMQPGTELIPGLGHSLVHLGQLIESLRRMVKHYWKALNYDGEERASVTKKEIVKKQIWS
jgi:hypothetical protein